MYDHAELTIPVYQKSFSQRGCLVFGPVSRQTEGEWDLGAMDRRDILQDAHGQRRWAREVTGSR